MTPAPAPDGSTSPPSGELTMRIPPGASGGTLHDWINTIGLLGLGGICIAQRLGLL